MNRAIEYLKRKSDSLDKEIQHLKEREKLLNIELKTIIEEKRNTIHMYIGINAAIDKLLNDESESGSDSQKQ